MPATARITTTTTIAGAQITSIVERSQESAERLTLDLPASIAGTLTTRTDADTGVLTVPTGHGITTSDTVAVFFAGGVKHNCTVSATTGTTISITSTDGTDLPALNAAIVVGKQSDYELLLTGDNIAVLVIRSVTRCLVDFRTDVPASVLLYDIPAGEGREWVVGKEIANPLAGDAVARVHVANGGTSAAAIDIGLLKNLE
jgi:hypothetical protein